MRIAYVTADLGVPVFGRKGCSIHVQEVLRALLGRGAEIDLFTTSGDGEPPDGLAATRVHPLPRPPKGDPAAREQAAMALNDLLHKELGVNGPFDLIYERYSLWSYAAMEFARERALPGLLEINAPLIEEQAEYRILVDRAGAKRVAERAFGAATALLAVSEEVAGYLNGFPSTQGKVHVVPNGVRPERFAQKLKPGAPAPADVFTVGFIGTLKAWHGLPILVEAFGLLHARHPRSRLLIVGDGPERESLSATVAAYRLGHAVQLFGAVAPDKVPALLASMDAAVAPYPSLKHFYFSPLKVYEYMAAGLPVVASRIGQLEHIIETERTGLLVPPGDAAALAGALERLLTNEDLRLQLGRLGRDYVQREHTWDRVAERILGIAGMTTQVKASLRKPSRPQMTKSQ